MKHIYTFLAVGALSALGLSAQSKIDLQGRILLEKINEASLPKTERITELTPLSTNSKTVETKKISRLSTIVVLNNGFTAADIEAAGYTVTSDLNSVALVTVNATDVEKLAELDAVRQISFGRTLQHYLDNARSFAGINQIHDGIEYGGSTYSFTGKGVCTGIYDTGIDVNHVNFLNEDGTTRVKQLQEYYENEDGELYRAIYNDPSEFTTDSEEETHGTHTTGIMAGGYKGTTKYVNVYPNGSSWSGGFVEDANPYYGVAPESDLLISAGILDDAASLDGFTRMASYAKENGQPCVINYSVGSIMGPHDGTDAFSKAVSEITNEYGAIFCMAAGNSAGNKCCLQKTFASASDPLKSCITPHSSYSTTQVQALIDIWADDDTPFTLKLNSYKPKVLFGSAQNKTILTIDAADQAYQLAHVTSGNYTKNTDLANHYSGAQIIMFSEVDPNNNRFHVMGLVIYSRSSTLGTTTNSFLHLEIQSQPGKSVMVNLQNAGEFTAQSTVSGSVEGNDTNTISDGCCNPDVISVGAYMSRRYYASLAGSVSYLNEDSYVEGSYVGFSSYGATPDGRQLPEVLGPGYNMLSSYSSYYVAKGNEGETSTDMSAEATVGEKTHYWGEMSGTSMATPFVAGTIALWLEADPTLTVSDIHRLIATTSTSDEALAGKEEKTGYGRINPVEGLKEILSNSVSGLGAPDADLTDRYLIIDQQQGSVSAFLAGETALTATLYNTSGVAVATVKTSGADATLNTSSLPAGIYVLRVEGASGNTATRKIALR